MSTTDTSTTEAGAPPASWYPDPTGRHRLRWWDGTAWTQRVADGPEGQAAAAPVAPQVAEPEPAREPEPEPEGGALFQPIEPEPFDPAAEAARRAEQQAQEGQAAPQEQQALAPATIPEPEPEPEAVIDAEAVAKPTSDEPFVGIDRPRAGRVPPAERASTGAGLDNPLPRKGLLITIGVVLIVAASLSLGLVQLRVRRPLAGSGRGPPGGAGHPELELRCLRRGAEQLGEPRGPADRLPAADG